MKVEQIYEILPTQVDCLKFLTSVIWNDCPVCPYCTSNKQTKLTRENRHHCNNCNTSYSILTRTIFHNTKLDIQKWFRLLFIINNGEIFSVRQLSMNLSVSKDTALRMNSLIRSRYIENKPLIEKIIKMLNEYK
ncbi:transposase [Flavobacterium sp. RHBU_24]|uniref:transposase n=1 Tax=Flavobacterium sp. RHBU_24 TaxID=3391185 RepID=UPI003984F5D7